MMGFKAQLAILACFSQQR